MRWPGWRYIPAMKPLAVAGFVFTVVMIIRYAAAGAETDIPPNLAGLVKTVFLVCLGVYGGKSVVEHGMDRWMGGHGDDENGD